MTIIERLQRSLDKALYIDPDDLAALLECVKAQNEALRLIADGQANKGQTVGPMHTYQMRNVAKAAILEAQKKVGLET